LKIKHRQFCFYTCKYCKTVLEKAVTLTYKINSAVKRLFTFIRKLTKMLSMKTKILLLLSQIFLLSCNSPISETGIQDNHLHKAGTGNLQAEASTPVPQTNLTGENDEYLDWGRVLINGKLPLVTSVKNMEGLLGKADSVISINWDNTCSSRYASEDSKNAYFDGMQFEQFRDSLDFQQINFSKNHGVFLQSGSLKLNHATTLDEIKKHFPKAVKNISKGFYLIDGKKTDAVNLPPSKDLSEGQWILVFQNGKLIRIDNWFPC
jgi:hypothetical protein